VTYSCAQKGGPKAAPGAYFFVPGIVPMGLREFQKIADNHRHMESQRSVAYGRIVRKEGGF
jgi:hypothetical protein